MSGSLHGHRAMRGRRGRGGFSLVEVVVSIVIVATMFTVAMNTVGASRAGLRRSSDLVRARLLGHELMTEILQGRYRESDLPGGSLGPEAGESGAGRSAFDDVDDYDGWLASPPARRDGTAIGHLAGWEQLVEVDWVQPGDPETTAALESGVKRIVVRIRRGGALLAEVHALRANLEGDA